MKLHYDEEHVVRSNDWQGLFSLDIWDEDEDPYCTVLGTTVEECAERAEELVRKFNRRVGV